MSKIILLFSVLVIAACQTNTNHKKLDTSFDVERVKSIIVNRGKQWGLAVQNNDISIIADLYDKNAHYLPDSESSIHGNVAITQYWEKELSYLKNIELSLESLEGTKELLYETGKGETQLVDPKGVLHTIHFKYVNVWKLNTDGNYRVVIDTYNNVAKSQ